MPKVSDNVKKLPILGYGCIEYRKRKPAPYTVPTPFLFLKINAQVLI
jgi:hypothetical protein